MDPESSLELLGLLLCLLVVAFASAAESALTAITRHRLNALQQERGERAQALMRLFENPYRLRGTTLILTTVATITATGLMVALTRDLTLGGQIAALAGLTLLLLIAGAALPKAIATARPDATAISLARPLQIAMLLCTPLLWLLGLLLRPVTGNNPGGALVTEEELKLLVNVGEEEGLIEADEREMIEGVFAFGDTFVREVMVPRIDVMAMPADSTVREALDIFLAAGHSRIPIYEDSIDQIVGVLYLKDLLPLVRDNRHQESARPIARAPFYIPETMKVDDLLKAMQHNKVHMAVIVDEYGGTAGLVTIEDLVEEIVGEIQDEYDVEDPEIEELAPTEWRILGRVSLDEVNEHTGLHLESAEVDSLGGYVSERLGSIPHEGDTVEVPGATIIVDAVQRLRPLKLRLLLQQTEQQLAAGAEEDQGHG